jgi:hypothetical protein
MAIVGEYALEDDVEAKGVGLRRDRRNSAAVSSFLIAPKDDEESRQKSIYRNRGSTEFYPFGAGDAMTTFD